MDLIISANLIIPSKELKWRFSRSSGPGGQKVNKTSTKVEIIFNIDESKVLNVYQKNRLINQDKIKLINNCICIEVQNQRNQFLNRKIALLKLSYLIRSLLNNSYKIRKATKIPKAAHRRRLDLKRKRSELKKSRKIFY